MSSRTGSLQLLVFARVVSLHRTIDWILDHIVQNSGVSIGNMRLTDMDYVDDVALVDGQTDNLRTALERLETEAASLGLHVPWQRQRYRIWGQVDQLL
jgi:hypothetical protein